MSGSIGPHQFSSSYATSSEGFQGLAWGSSLEQIKKKFPQAKQSEPDTQKFPICKKSDGTAYECTVSESLCNGLGILCSPPLVIDKYMVGTYPFQLSFELSKSRMLSSVSLEYAGGLDGKSEQHGLGIYEHVSSSLEKKYGKPIEIEEYRRRWRNPYVGARKVWRTKQTQINVNYSGVLNASTNLLEHVTLTVIYSPLMDDFSSKL